MLERLRHWPEAAGLLAAIGFGLLFFALTDPKTVPSAFFIVGFGVLMVGLYCLLKLIGRFSGLQARLRPFTYKTLLIGGTLLPTMLLALQSIGQLTPRDVVTLLVFFAGAYFYVSRLRGAE